MEFKDIIRLRRTIRKFKQIPIKREQLESYIDFARVAPSAANMQPLKYICVHSKDMVDKVFPLLKWAGYLAGEYNPKPDEKPTAYIVVCGDSNIRKDGYDMDVGAAVENIILSALCDGVGSCWLASVDREKLIEILDIPENFAVSCVVALGYPAEKPCEVDVQNGDIKYYLNNDTLCVPKRSLKEALIKTV